MDTKFLKFFEDLGSRMTLVEQTVFNAEGPEFRFERLEKAYEDLNILTKQNYEHHNGQRDVLD